MPDLDSDKAVARKVVILACEYLGLSIVLNLSPHQQSVIARGHDGRFCMAHTR